MPDNSARIERLKETNKNVRVEREAVRSGTNRDKERLTGQKGDYRNVHSIRLILSFCAAAQLQCADYESII